MRAALGPSGNNGEALYKQFGRAAHIQSAVDELRAFACHLDTFFFSGKIRDIHLLSAFKVMKGCVLI